MLCIADRMFGHGFHIYLQTGNTLFKSCDLIRELLENFIFQRILL
jgi:hypothetical protein